jgi:predicted glycosyltransferase
MERLACLKLASLEVIGECGVEKTSYLIFAQQWIRKAVELLKPDVFVVDTFPQGAFNELPQLLTLARKRCLICRPCRTAQEERYQSALSDYDALLVPELREHAHIVVPHSLQGRVEYYGPVIARDTQDLLSREEARSRLGVNPQHLVIYASLGGGGDPAAQSIFDWILLALKQLDNVRIVVGAGSLYRGVIHHSSNVIWWSDLSACELMHAFDIAISAAGYNSFVELMHFGVPTIFLPLSRISDDQEGRAERAAKGRRPSSSSTCSAKPTARRDSTVAIPSGES